MLNDAVTKCPADARASYNDIQQACIGYCYGESTCGQRVLYSLGLSGIPIYNLYNNCSTASMALLMPKQFVEGGISDCVVAVGVENMQNGALQIDAASAVNPRQRHLDTMVTLRGKTAAPCTPQIFGNAGREYMEKCGSSPGHFVKVAWKDHYRSVNNPYAQLQASTASTTFGRLR